jgi:hypothetical protein
VQAIVPNFTWKVRRFSCQFSHSSTDPSAQNSKPPTLKPLSGCGTLPVFPSPSVRPYCSLSSPFVPLTVLPSFARPPPDLSPFSKSFGPSSLFTSTTATSVSPSRPTSPPPRTSATSTRPPAPTPTHSTRIAIWRLRRRGVKRRRRRWSRSEDKEEVLRFLGFSFIDCFSRCFLFLDQYQCPFVRSTLSILRRVEKAWDSQQLSN